MSPGDATSYLGVRQPLETAIECRSVLLFNPIVLACHFCNKCHVSPVDEGVS